MVVKYTSKKGALNMTAQNPGAKKCYYVYLLRCADDTLYGGWTVDLERRLRAHNSGQGAKYTAARLPVRLVYWEACGSKREAMRREYRLKRLSRAQKLLLIGKL